MLMRTELFWGITQRQVVIFYRRFGTTSIASSRVKKSKESNFDFLTLENGAETSEKDYDSTLGCTAEQLNSHKCRLFIITGE
jgi:hypothetical protein